MFGIKIILKKHFLYNFVFKSSLKNLVFIERRIISQFFPKNKNYRSVPTCLPLFTYISYIIYLIPINVKHFQKLLVDQMNFKSKIAVVLYSNMYINYIVYIVLLVNIDLSDEFQYKFLCVLVEGKN